MAPTADSAVIVLEVSRCDCTGPSTITFDENWPSHVVAYHLPQECPKSRRETVTLQRSNYRPRPWRGTAEPVAAS